MKISFERFLYIMLLISSSMQAKTQDIKVNGQFLADSLRVGDEVFFTVSAWYASDTQIIFPDSSFNFAPFEFKRKRYFITETRNGLSFDSAVYHLTTFETDSLLRLRVPVYKVNQLDCTRYFTNWDTVKMSLLVRVLPEKISADLPVRATLGYQPVSKVVNYQFVFILGGLGILLAAIVWVIIGGRVSQHYRIKRMKKVHDQFMISYARELERVKHSFSPESTESAVALWKKYMEKINSQPYTKLTSYETLLLEKDQNLARDLRTVDSAIYGSNRDVITSLNHLQDFADQRFNRILKEVKNEQ